jgi:hypothetical protein
MTIVATIVRTIGLPICAILVLLAYYEGIPGFRDIPYADRIPVVRELIVGRVGAERAKAAVAARSGYVALSEKTALEAQLAKERRDRLLASQFYDEAQKRATAAAAAKKVADEKLEEIIREDAAQPGGSIWTNDDDRWVRNHRGKAN